MRDGNEKMTFTEYLQSIGACAPAVRWSSGKTAREAWATCAEPKWGIWWVARVKGFAAVEPVVRRAVLRASRGYAAAACDREGLADPAAKLRAIPDDASFAMIRQVCAANAAYAAADAAYAAADAAYAAASYAYAAERGYQLADLRELCSPPWTEDGTP